VRVTHLEIASPKYFTPLSPIPFPPRKRFKELRMTQFEIPPPKNFAPFSPILF